MQTKSTITQKINIAKIGILIFHSIQLSEYLSCIYGHLSGVVNWEKPSILLYHIQQLTVGGHEEICDKMWGMVLKWLGTTALARVETRKFSKSWGKKTR